MGVSVYRIFVGACDSLEHFYGWMWVDVTGCGWVGKMVKPKKNTYSEEHLRTNAFMLSYIFIIFLIIVDTIITFTTIEKCTFIV